MSESGSLRIGIDISPLRPPLTGIGNYELCLLRALLARADAPDFEGFDRLRWRHVDLSYLEMIRSDAPDLNLSYLLRRNRFFPAKPISGAYTKLRRAIFEATQFSKRISAFHAFSYLAPGRIDAPIIPVVYDVSFVRFPDMHPIDRLRRLAGLEKQMRAAPVVHTISRFSASEISDVFGIPLERIAVIHPAVNPDFVGFKAPMEQAVLAKYKVEQQSYFLVVSTLEPRKNLRTLVAAYSQLSESLRQRFPLCVAGPSGWGDLELPSEWSLMQRHGTLRFLGFVPNADLRVLYEHTRAMFFPSVYEGFGIPIIDALACGAPVVCSDIPSMAEAGGAVTDRVPALDTSSWLQQLRAAIERPCDDAAKVEARKAHAFGFSWGASAEKVRELYRKAITS